MKNYNVQFIFVVMTEILEIR